MTPVGHLAGPASLFGGIQPSDLEVISAETVVSALVITAIGLVALRVLAARSVSMMVTVVVLASVLTSLAGVGVIAHRMLSGVDQRVVLDLMVIARLASLAVALFVGPRLTRASRALASAVQGVGENGVYVAPQATLPTELAELSKGSPSRTSGWPRPGPGSAPWRPAGASSSPGSATTCALRWPVCGPWPRRWKTRW